MKGWNEIWSDYENSRYVRPSADPGIELHATIREEADGEFIILDWETPATERAERDRL